MSYLTGSPVKLITWPWGRDPLLNFAPGGFNPLPNVVGKLFLIAEPRAKPLDFTSSFFSPRAENWMAPCSFVGTGSTWGSALLRVSDKLSNALSSFVKVFFLWRGLFNLGGDKCKLLSAVLKTESFTDMFEKFNDWGWRELTLPLPTDDSLPWGAVTFMW